MAASSAKLYKKTLEDLDFRGKLGQRLDTEGPIRHEDAR